MRSVVVLVGLALSGESEAGCKILEDCRCLHAPAWAAIIVLSPDAGATIESISRVAGSDAGPSAARLEELRGDAGRYLLAPLQPPSTVKTFFEGPLPVGADGTLHCETASFEPTAWTQALTDRSCQALLADAGAVPRECHDVSRCGCSVDVMAAPLLAGVLLLRRSRRR